MTARRSRRKKAARKPAPRQRAATSPAASRETLDRFTAVFDNSPDSIAITRRADGVILAVNDAWVRLNGYTRAQAVGRPAPAVGHWLPGEREAVLGEFARSGRVDNRLTALKRRDGNLRQSLISAVPVKLDGEPCVLWIGRDVTELQRAESERRQALDRFSAVFTHSPDPIAISSLRDRTIVAVNDAWVRINGYTRERVVGRTSQEIGVWSDEQRDAFLRELKERGSVQSRLVQFRRADGSLRESLISAAQIEIGDEPCVIMMGRDVTELRRAEEELRSSQRLLEAVVDAIPMSIFAKDLDSKYIMLNKRMAEFFGLPKADLLHRHTLELPVSDATRAKSLADDQWVFRNLRPLEQPDVMLGGPDGRQYAYHSTKLPLLDEAGRLIGLLGINRDISEQKRNEQLLGNIASGVSAQLGESFFTSLVTHLCRELGADFVLVGELVEPERDRVRTLAYCRDGTTQPNFEYTLPGSPCSNALTQKGTVAYASRVAELFPQDLQLRAMGVEGYIGTPLHDVRGAAIGILAVMTRKSLQHQSLWTSVLEIYAARAAAEIERARAEMRVRELNATLERRVRERTAELEMANAELESYSYSVSHDLRAPLRGIASFASLLRSRHAGALPEEAHRLLERVEGNAVQMRRLIDDLLEFSRSGRATLQMRPLDMRALAEQVVRELQPAADAGIVIGELPPARGDGALMRQVWHNLVENAIKFSGRTPGAQVEIGGARRDGRLEYFVRDNGAGFDMAYAAKLFGVFERLHRGDEFEGTGVGLAIVQRIVQRHGGSVHAEGEPGHGATFRFTLPGD